MAILRIHIYGDPILREKAATVAAVDDGVRELIADMTETMYAAGGVGLAATQVGILKRLFIADVAQVEKPDKDSTPKTRSARNPQRRQLLVFINPEILSSGTKDCSYTEGCLSLPGIDGEVYRPDSIRVRYQDVEGAAHEIDASGYLARVIQHEMDHLDGVLFIDRMAPGLRRKLAGELARMREMAAQNPDGISAEQTKSMLRGEG